MVRFRIRGHFDHNKQYTLEGITRVKNGGEHLNMSNKTEANKEVGIERSSSQNKDCDLFFVVLEVYKKNLSFRSIYKFLVILFHTKTTIYYWMSNTISEFIILEIVLYDIWT